jgi:hypothetical protein
MRCRCIEILETGNKKQCCNETNNKFCDKHKYMEDYTEEMIKKLILCHRCHYTKYSSNGSSNCETCKKECREYNAKKRAEKKAKKITCNGITKSGRKCWFEPSKGSKYCEDHKYMEKYTDEMMKNLTQCSNCHSYYFKTDTDFLTCEWCRNKDKKVVKLETEKCKYIFEDGKSCIHPAKTDGYCMKHQKEAFKQKVEKSGKKVCVNYIRGCEVILDKDYKYSKCEECLDLDRKRDKNRRNKIKLENQEKIRTGKDEKLKCTKCGKLNDKKWFMNNSIISNKCKSCREKAEIIDSNRLSHSDRFNINDKISEIKNRARKHNIDFKLTDEKVKELVNGTCKYCGIKPEEGYFLGIDRIDNNKGYILGNVQTSCWRCNQFKYNHTVDEFLTYCKNINENFGCTDLSNCEKEYAESYRIRCDLRKRNRKREKLNKKLIEYKLTDNEIHEFIKHKCFYCADKNCGYEIGLDRIDSNGDYIKENINPACKICNFMKNDLNINEFKEHIKKILKFNDKEHIIIPKRRVPEKITKEWIIKELEKASINSKLEKNTIPDYKNKNYLKHDYSYYINKIYDTKDINKFNPELEFCETDEQLDLWLGLRLKISSFEYKNFVGRVVKILIRDIKTKKYIGIASLSSVVKEMIPIHDFVEEGHRMDIKTLNHVMDISTCVGIPPFSYNFNGGKLVTMLMFSKEVFDYVFKKYNDKLAMIITFSLYGESIQYDRLKELSLIDLTNGEGISHIDGNLHDAIVKYMKQEYPDKHFKSNMCRIAFLTNNLKIRELAVSGKVRGIYAGFTSKQSRDFLTKKITDFEPDLIRSVDVIFNDWKTRWACKRFSHLLEENRVQLTDDYINSVLDVKDYNRIKKLRSRNKNTESLKKIIKLTDEQKLEIIKYKKDNIDITLNDLVKYFTNKFNRTISRSTVSKLIA